MRTLETVVTVRFWADYPDDDGGADIAIDAYCDWIIAQVARHGGIADGSVVIDDADTVTQ